MVAQIVDDIEDEWYRPTVFAITKTGETIQIRAFEEDDLEEANNLTKNLATMLDTKYLEGKENTYIVIDCNPDNDRIQIIQENL